MGVVFLGLFVTSQLLGYGIFGIAKEAYFELYGNLTERELRWYVVLAVFGSPFVEELLFRGILYRYLSQSVPKWICFVLSTLLFIWVHGSYTHIFVTLAVSCMSVWLIEITGAIWPSFIMHALYNVLGISFQLSMPVPSWIYIIGFWLLFDLVCVGIIRSDFFRDLCRYGRFPSVESMIDKKRKELGRKIDSDTDA
jgi:membrane protease YdiL (CAAX protease family)